MLASESIQLLDSKVINNLLSDYSVTLKTMEKAKTQQSYEHNLLNEYLLHRNTTEKAKHRSIRIALFKKRDSTLIYNLTQPKGLKKFRWSLGRPKPTYLLEK